MKKKVYLTEEQIQEIRKQLLAGQRAKVLAYDYNVSLRRIYTIANDPDFREDYLLKQQIARIERVTKALEENQYTNLRKLVKASRVSFKRLKPILEEIRA